MAEPPVEGAPKAAGGLKATLTRKVGPLPLWAYGAIAIVGVLALRLFAGRSAATKTSASGLFAPGGPSAPSDNLLPTAPLGPGDPVVIPAPPGETAPTTGNKPVAPAIPTMLGKSALALAPEPVGGWKTPPLFQAISPTAVIDSTGGGQGRVNPKNVLVGFSDATGTLFSEPGPGRTAIWK